MSRVVHWLQHHETRVFHFVNQRIQHFFLDHFFNKITHLGGATASIAISLCFALFGQGSLQTAGIQALLALTFSHIPVAIIKKKYPRLRPYLVHPQTITYKNPLTDHSFPSGHTTAIFSIVFPFCYSRTCSWTYPYTACINRWSITHLPRAALSFRLYRWMFNWNDSFSSDSSFLGVNE